MPHDSARGIGELCSSAGEKSSRVLNREEDMELQGMPRGV